MITWNMDPVLLDLGPLELRWYGLCFAFGLLATYLLTGNLMKKKGYKLEDLESLSVYLILGVILGSRIGHILFYSLDYYLAHPSEILMIWKGGLSSHGGILGTILAYLLFLKKHPQYKFFDLADLLCVSGSLMIIFVRLGNFFNSEIVGKATDAPWGVLFERFDPTTPRHPSQVYEMLIGVFLLFFLYGLWSKRHKELKAGFFCGLFFVLYFSMRFTAEFFKDLAIHDNLWGLTTGQFLSLPFIALGLYFLFGKKLRQKQK